MKEVHTAKDSLVRNAKIHTNCGNMIHRVKLLNISEKTVPLNGAQPSKAGSICESIGQEE